MHFLHQVRSLRTWSRALLVGLALAFGLNSIAHAAHEHDPASASSLHSTVCSYCASFGGLGPAPVHLPTPVARLLDCLGSAFTAAAPLLPRLWSTAQPRAPPELLNAGIAVI